MKYINNAIIDAYNNQIAIYESRVTNYISSKELCKKKVNEQNSLISSLKSKQEECDKYITLFNKIIQNASEYKLDYDVINDSAFSSMQLDNPVLIDKFNSLVESFKNPFPSKVIIDYQVSYINDLITYFKERKDNYSSLNENIVKEIKKIQDTIKGYDVLLDKDNTILETLKTKLNILLSLDVSDINSEDYQLLADQLSQNIDLFSKEEQELIQKEFNYLSTNFYMASENIISNTDLKSIFESFGYNYDVIKNIVVIKDSEIILEDYLTRFGNASNIKSILQVFDKFRYNEHLQSLPPARLKQKMEKVAFMLVRSGPGYIEEIFKFANSTIQDNQFDLMDNLVNKVSIFDSRAVSQQMFVQTRNGENGNGTFDVEFGSAQNTLRVIDFLKEIEFSNNESSSCYQALLSSNAEHLREIYLLLLNLGLTKDTIIKNPTYLYRTSNAKALASSIDKFIEFGKSDYAINNVSAVVTHCYDLNYRISRTINASAFIANQHNDGIDYDYFFKTKGLSKTDIEKFVMNGTYSDDYLVNFQYGYELSEDNKALYDSYDVVLDRYDIKGRLYDEEIDYNYTDSFIESLDSEYKVNNLTYKINDLYISRLKVRKVLSKLSRNGVEINDFVRVYALAYGSYLNQEQYNSLKNFVEQRSSSGGAR